MATCPTAPTSARSSPSASRVDSTARKDVRLLSPFDLQCIKASGVTFAISAMERVIEERCRGDASKADSLRASLRDRIGADIRSVKPGSEAGEETQGRR